MRGLVVETSRSPTLLSSTKDGLVGLLLPCFCSSLSKVGTNAAATCFVEVYALKKVGLALGGRNCIRHDGQVVKLYVQRFPGGPFQHTAKINNKLHVVDPQLASEVVVPGAKM